MPGTILANNAILGCLAAHRLFKAKPGVANSGKTVNKAKCLDLEASILPRKPVALEEQAG